jgi:D-xylonolactonase
MSITPELVWPIAAQLGEGPAWFADDGCLRFVDIKGGRLHSFCPATGQQETMDAGGQPSFVLPAGDRRLVVGNGHELVAIDRDGRNRTLLATLPMPLNNRTNDATVDGSGRLWLGTMDDKEQHPTGALWCWTQGALHHLGQTAVVTNGPAISRDGATLYFVDSGSRAIWRHVVTVGPGITARTLFLQLGEEDGYPDGIVLDAEGCLWVALWDGWCLRRYAPDGEMLLQVDLPCARVTKIAFGGPELRTAYVTTARIGLDDAALASQPLAGGLFAFDAPVAGLPLPAVRLA